jgi:hypothetical protein
MHDEQRRQGGLSPDAQTTRRYADDLAKKAAISIVTRALQPVFLLDTCPAGGPGRAPFAKLWRLTREFLCCELQNGMILPVCNLQRPRNRPTAANPGVDCMQQIQRRRHGFIARND